MSDVQSALEGIHQIFNIWVGLIIAVTGGIISITNFFYSRKKDKFTSLFEVFLHLSNDKHREARRVLYYADKDASTSSKVILGFDAPSETVVRISKDIVRDDMDQIGLMVKKGLIPEKEFLERYWKTVVHCRLILDRQIRSRRQMKGYEDYVMNFDFLFNRANAYAKEKNLKWTEIHDNFE